MNIKIYSLCEQFSWAPWSGLDRFRGAHLSSHSVGLWCVETVVVEVGGSMTPEATHHQFISVLAP